MPEQWIAGRQLCKRWEMTPDEIIRELGMHVIPLFERFSQDDLVSLVNGEEVPIALQKVPAKTYIFGKSLVAEAMRRRAKHDKDAELLRKANTYVWEHVRDCLFRLEDIEALERECPWLNPGAKARRKDQIDQALARARAEAWWKKDPSLGLKDMAEKILAFQNSSKRLPNETHIPGSSFLKPSSEPFCGYRNQRIRRRLFSVTGWMCFNFGQLEPVVTV